MGRAFTHHQERSGEDSDRGASTSATEPVYLLTDPTHKPELCQSGLLLEYIVFKRSSMNSYPDQSRVRYMTVELEKVTDLNSLLPPLIATDTPTERELQALTVEGPICAIDL